jgi:hypothetical protein
VTDSAAENHRNQQGPDASDGTLAAMEQREIPRLGRAVS